MICPLCKEETFPDATVCRFCGAVLPGIDAEAFVDTSRTHCSSCQEVVPSDASYCPHCGVTIQQAATGQTTRLSDYRPTSRPKTQLLRLPCPKCQGYMEHGFIPEHVQGRRDALVWVSGDTERSKWTNSMIVADRQMWAIRSYRCVVCGYIELYASENLS